jgi:hypothetical protein
VTFVPQATADQVTKFLQERHATIVDGPKALGMFRVRFEANGAPKEETDRVAKDLQQSRNIVGTEYPTN